MAKYWVTYSCGHEDKIELLGKESDRKRKIEYYEANGLCPDCYRAKKAQEISETHEEVEMLYSEYKNKYSNCRTKNGSYDAKEKTIVVYVEK